MEIIFEACKEEKKGSFYIPIRRFYTPKSVDFRVHVVNQIVKQLNQMVHDPRSSQIS